MRSFSGHIISWLSSSLVLCSGTLVTKGILGLTCTQLLLCGGLIFWVAGFGAPQPSKLVKAGLSAVQQQLNSVLTTFYALRLSYQTTGHGVLGNMSFCEFQNLTF